MSSTLGPEVGSIRKSRAIALSRAPSELQDGSQTEHGSVLESLSRLVDAARIRRAPARMGDVLKVWVQREAGPDFVLIDCGNEPFVGAGRSDCAVQVLEIGIERLGPHRDARIASGDTEFIFRSTFAETHELDARI